MSLLHDLRFALRLIAKERWFTAVAVAALALGIGVNATVFTLVNQGSEPHQLFVYQIDESVPQPITDLVRLPRAAHRG